MLKSGFSNASGLTVDDEGTAYFTDAAKGKIYRWNGAKRTADVLAEIRSQPQVLGFVAPASLLAVANERAVYRLSSSAPGLGTHR